MRSKAHWLKLWYTQTQADLGLLNKQYCLSAREDSIRFWSSHSGCICVFLFGSLSFGGKVFWKSISLFLSLINSMIIINPEMWTNYLQHTCSLETVIHLLPWHGECWLKHDFECCAPQICGDLVSDLNAEGIDQNWNSLCKVRHLS